mmetsp:Transcript_15524/g.50895  ORF Transcript_15524/g.50895 Transcript_15524/m.50895 type:complete len:84 (+) Transcript_15524:3949-4200(+)
MSSSWSFCRQNTLERIPESSKASTPATNAHATKLVIMHADDSGTSDARHREHDDDAIMSSPPKLLLLSHEPFRERANAHRPST